MLIYPGKNKIISFLLELYIKRLIRKFFWRVSVFNEQNFNTEDENISTILIANHSSWWDGFIAWLITSYYLKVEDYLLMDHEQLKKYRFFRFLGAFSVEKQNPVSLKKTFEFITELLKTHNRYLWYFPQGAITPQDARPVIFRKGIYRIIENIEQINIIPVALRYEFTSEQRPEVFVMAGNPILTGKSSPSEINSITYLEEGLTETMDRLKDFVIREKFKNFKTIISGKPSRNRTLDSITGC